MTTLKISLGAVALFSPCLAVRPDVGFRLKSTQLATWGESALSRVCHDPENCGPYSTEGRCRDAFCAGCSLGTCETLEEAQQCCEENSDCTAVYGGGAHWWTFNAPCEEEDHPNYYHTWHRDGDSPNPPKPTAAPPTNPPPTGKPPTMPPGEPNQDFPAGLLECISGPPALKTSCSSDLAGLNTRVRQVVTNHFNTLSSTCNDDGCPRGDLAGCLVRLAGHDIMDFNPSLNNGGADGCIDFQDPDNAGLKGCMLSAVHERDSSNISLELMWQDFCTEVSAADFFVIAAEALMTVTTPSNQRNKWDASFKSNFKFGRQTAVECSPEPLPNPIHACDAVKEVFVERMGLTWTQATALMGVHTLGRALPENSGYDGFWVSQNHARTFSPEYYNRIVGVGWSRHQVSSGKFQWKRADRKLLGEFMLNTDMCLAFQSGREAPLTRAEDGNMTGCCLWVDANHADMRDVICNCQGNSVSEGCSHSNCCKSERSGCPGNDPFRRFMGSRGADLTASYDAVIKYAKTATGFDAWHDDFHPTWSKATSQGHSLCDGSVTQPPVTQPPVTQPPVTQPPVTQPPATQPPATQPPTSNPDFPAGLLSCSSGPAAVRTSCSANLGQLNTQIRNTVTAHHNSLSAACNDRECPRGDLSGCLVRLAGHDVMDFNAGLNNGGADGCIDFTDPDNGGLKGCMLTAINERDSSNVSLELMWQDFCTQVSAADFFVIAAEALMTATTPSSQRGKWRASFTNNFRFGRQTAFECSPEPLPNPIHSCDAVKEVFVDRMGLTWTQSTALMGVHTLGRALPENSGYDGFWVSQNHARTFSPEYFNRIVGVGWSREQVASGKFQWKRADRALQGEFMLNTDMCLAFQSGRQAPLTRAEDGNHSGCCLWKDRNDADMADVICNCQGNSVSEGCTLSNCCKSERSGCPGNDPFRRFMRGRAASSVESYDAVIKYAKTATGFDAWHDDFIPTWEKVTSQGHSLC